MPGVRQYIFRLGSNLEIISFFSDFDNGSLQDSIVR